MHRPNIERAERARKLALKHHRERGACWENNEFLACNIRERALHGISDELDTNTDSDEAVQITSRSRAPLNHGVRKATVKNTYGF
ncbi:MAG: hypothetical protein RLZZ283_413 [Candidatus Parcubacteria bacterium]